LKNPAGGFRADFQESCHPQPSFDRRFWVDLRGRLCRAERHPVTPGTPASSRFDANLTFICGRSSAPLLSLDPLRAGGNVNFARAAALKNRKALKALLTDTDVVCLVAGLGGGTGSRVAPITARLAREAGVLPVAGVVMPFGFEERDQIAKVALDHLRRQTELVRIFSNDECLQARNEEISFEEGLIFKAQFALLSRPLKKPHIIQPNSENPAGRRWRGPRRDGVRVDIGVARSDGLDGTLENGQPADKPICLDGVHL
jgi:tubulin/FtsZ family protein